MYPPIFVGLLAVFEIGVSRRIKAAIAHREGSRPVAAIFVARCVALGKASAYAGGVFAGAAGGFLIWAAPKISTVNAVASDSASAALLLAAGIALAVAGLLLEQSGVDPGPKERSDPEKSRPQR